MGVIHLAQEYYSLKIIPVSHGPLPADAHHDHYQEWSGKIRLAIQTMSNVFVGTGDYEIDDNGIYAAFSRSQDRIFIPGSSIKGAVRNYAEALSPSCKGGVCRAEHNRICISCRLFGSLGFQGRITFCDTELLSPTSVDLDIYEMSVRWSGGFKDGRRFYRHASPEPHLPNPKTGDPMPDERVEVVPEGTGFASELIFENLTDVEMGLLLLAMGMGLQRDLQFNLKLGGGKNRCLGSVRFDATSGIQLLSEATFTSLTAVPQNENVSDWGQRLIVAYWDSLSAEHQETVQSNIEAFQTDP